MNHILKRRVRFRVLVSTKTAGDFEGVLIDQDKQAIVLGSASAIDPHAEQRLIPADGELVILLADIAYFQFL